MDRGSITGNFTYDGANQLAVQLRYGALPIPLKIVETRTIGPTLGKDSLDKSMIAGAIGAVLVMLFMALYYRLPGLIADLAIIIYAVITFALYRRRRRDGGPIRVPEGPGMRGSAGLSDIAPDGRAGLRQLVGVAVVRAVAERPSARHVAHVPMTRGSSQSACRSFR